MNYLILDTETESLNEDIFITFENLISCPPIKQIAWLIYDSDGNKIKEHNIYLNKDNTNEGVSKKATLEKLIQDIKEFNPVLVGHNIRFDKNIIGAELLRENLYHHLIELNYYCTMEQTVDYCSLPNNKWPKLQELNYKLFGTNYAGAHDALNDAKATARCFFELKSKRILVEPQTDSINNYNSYNDYISDLRNNITIAEYRCRALVELLRLFKAKPQEAELEDEISYLSNNYLNPNMDYFVNGIPLPPKDSNLSSLRKKFYLFHEKELINFFKLEEFVKKSQKLNQKNKIKSQFGEELFLVSLFIKQPKTKEDLKCIAKEYHYYIFLYELWFQSNNRQTISNSETPPSLTTTDLYDVLFKKFERKEIDARIILKILYGTNNKEVFQSVSEEVLVEMINELTSIINKIKQELDYTDAFLFATFLQRIENDLPISCKHEISKLKESLLNKHLKNESGCFIATLCYNNNNCKQIILFKHIRDNYLLNNYYGKRAVALYYKSSPIIIRNLINYPIIHNAIRMVVLEPVYKISSFILKLFSI